MNLSKQGRGGPASIHLSFDIKIGGPSPIGPDLLYVPGFHTRPTILSKVELDCYYGCLTRLKIHNESRTCGHGDIVPVVAAQSMALELSDRFLT